MVAFSASRLVCAEIEWISLTTSPIFSAPVDKTCTVALVRSASLTALLAISLDRVTCREISVTELDSSSAAAATVPTLLEALSEAAPTVAARALASLAVDVIDCAVACIPAAAADTERTMPLTLRSKSLAMPSMAARRSAAALVAFHEFAGQLPAVGDHVHAIGTDLLGIGRHHGDAVIIGTEQIARALVVGHRVGAAAEFGDRGLLGELTGVDLLLQRSGHVASHFDNRLGLVDARVQHLVLHQI